VQSDGKISIWGDENVPVWFDVRYICIVELRMQLLR
jgi:hypothetical protein